MDTKVTSRLRITPLNYAALAALFVLSLLCTSAFAESPLSSWHEGTNKQRIIDYIESVSAPDGESFVPVEGRVAVFDHDGTLWAEQPMYFQVNYLSHRLAEMATDHPEWKDKANVKSLLSGDVAGAMAQGYNSMSDLMQLSQLGTNQEEYLEKVRAWIDSSKHPTTDRAFCQMVYQPMLELLDFLRQREFEIYIVSGGSTQFMRAFTSDFYGVPADKVIGSRNKSELVEGVDGNLTVERVVLPSRINDGPQKVISIFEDIGRKPIFAFGNSDGDYQMLQWTSTHTPGFAGFVHHTDAKREWAYDRKSVVGRLDRALNDANANDWLVVNTKKDWKTVFVEDCTSRATANN